MSCHLPAEPPGRRLLMFPPAEWTQEMCPKQLALMSWKLRTLKGPWRVRLALITKG